MGIKVAKHGNKALSSKCGSADVLERLQININLEPDGVSKSIEKNNFGFMFAPNYHSAMKFVGPTRKKIGKRTIFNMIGPLSNPALVNRQVVGVFDKKWMRPFAEALRDNKVIHAFIVNSEDGIKDIDAIIQTKNTASGLMLPKIQSVDEILNLENILTPTRRNGVYAMFQETKPGKLFNGSDNYEEIYWPSQLLEIVINTGKKGLSLQRYKGLGEMNPDQLWETTLDPKNRSLIQVKIEDEAKTKGIFENLMGENVQPKKDFIDEHASNVVNLDI